MSIKNNNFVVFHYREINNLDMQTVLVEVDNQDGFHLLQELEKLHVLRIIKENVSEKKANLSDKYRGVFTKDDADSFMRHTDAMRNEWNNS